MATTTNYGWTTPNDTDLVKDGAAAIRTLGSSIDTTVFNNASAGIAKTIVDAKGDIIVATAADTVARLAVGANDTLLIADSSTATGLKWGTPAASGGMTLISTTSLSGTSTVLTSIPQTYKHLFLTFTNVTGSSNDSMQFRFNGNTSTQYSVLDFGDQSGTYISGGAINLNRIEISDFISTNALTGTANLYITDYTSTSATLKTISGWYMNRLNAGGNNNRFFNGRYQQTSAISSITIQSNGTVTFTGTVQLYGVN